MAKLAGFTSFKKLIFQSNPYPHGEAKVVDGEIHLLADEKFFWLPKRSIRTFGSVLKPSTKGRSTDQFLEHAEESQQFFAEPRIGDALNRNGWNRNVVTCVKDVITIEVNGVQNIVASQRRRRIGS